MGEPPARLPFLIRPCQGEEMKFSLTTAINGESFGPILLRGSPREVLSQAARLGYDGVELHLLRADQVDPVDTQKRMNEHGLTLVTIGTGMAAKVEGLTFADPNPEVRRQAVLRVKEHIPLAAALGSGITIASVMGRLGDDSLQRPRRRAAALSCLAECCNAAASAGITIFLEALNRYESDYLNKLEDTLSVITELETHNLKLLADTFHMNIEEADLSASLHRAGPHLGLVHFVDSNREAPGHGHLDMVRVMKTLKEINYQGFLSFEILPLPNPQQAAEDALSFARRILSILSSPDTRGMG
jgi:sugar phosphate isomerase/epimerase